MGLTAILVHLAHRPTPAAAKAAPVPVGSPPDGVKARVTSAGQVEVLS